MNYASLQRAEGGEEVMMCPRPRNIEGINIEGSAAWVVGAQTVGEEGVCMGGQPGMRVRI